MPSRPTLSSVPVPVLQVHSSSVFHCQSDLTLLSRHFPLQRWYFVGLVSSLRWVWFSISQSNW
jgi:hypothetical protein